MSVWRILIPTWRFFDRIGSEPNLWVRVDDRWIELLTAPKVNLFTLLFNAKGNLHHAHINLLERLIDELNASSSNGLTVHDLVSYRLVADIVRARAARLPVEFKVTARGEDVLKARLDI